MSSTCGNQNTKRYQHRLRFACDDYEKFYRGLGSLGNEGYYFWLKSELYKDDPKVKAKFNQIDTASKEIENSLRFFNYSSPTREVDSVTYADGVSVRLDFS